VSQVSLRLCLFNILIIFAEHNAYTSYKTRCAVKDCTKPARAPVSKYCSDVCGLKNAAAQLQALRARGVEIDQLWHAAKDAKAPEGVVFVHLPGGHIPHPPPAGVNNIGPNATKLMDGRQKADLEKLRMMNEGLAQFAARRAALEVEIKRLRARLRLLGCAMGRTEKAGAERCGFDVRIVMNDEEWAEWLEGEGKWALEEQVEGEEPKGETAYASAEGMFCAGKKRCERHNG
jgi:COMPASS component SPP1